MPDLAVYCRGLVKRYDDVVAVDGLDLDLHRGECLGLLGPNGAGKTTTVEILEGLLPADAGEVRVLGVEVARAGPALRERLGIQLQETQLPDKLTVEEVIRLFRSFYSRGEKVETVLDRVGLEEKRRAWVRKLSGGQRQRLSLACALVGRPDMLFLDEPTTGLDPQSRRMIWEVIRSFRRGGGTVLLTTHYMDEAEKLCDRVAVVDRGRVIAGGSPAELIGSLGAEHVVEFVADPVPDEALLSGLSDVVAVAREGRSIRLTVTEVHRAVPALLQRLDDHRCDLTGLTTHHATLEDVFVSLTGRHLRDG